MQQIIIYEENLARCQNQRI